MATVVNPVITQQARRPGIDLSQLNQGLADIAEMLKKKRESEEIRMAYDTYGGGAEGTEADPFAFQMHLMESGIDPVQSMRLSEPIVQRQAQQRQIESRNSVVAYLQQEGRLPEDFDPGAYTSPEQILDLVRGEHSMDMADAGLEIDYRQLSLAEQAEARQQAAARAGSGGGLRNNATDTLVAAYMDQYGLDPNKPSDVSRARIAVDNRDEIEGFVSEGIAAGMGRVGELMGDDTAGQRTSIAVDLATQYVLVEGLTPGQAAAKALQMVNNMSEEDLIVQDVVASERQSSVAAMAEAPEQAEDTQEEAPRGLEEIVRSAPLMAETVTGLTAMLERGESIGNPRANLNSLWNIAQSDGLSEAEFNIYVDKLVEMGVLQLD